MLYSTVRASLCALALTISLTVSAMSDLEINLNQLKNALDTLTGTLKGTSPLPSRGSNETVVPPMPPARPGAPSVNPVQLRPVTTAPSAGLSPLSSTRPSTAPAEPPTTLAGKQAILTGLLPQSGESTRPLKKPAPRPVALPKEEKITATPVQYIGINAQTQQLEAMPQRTPDEQRAMKNKATSILMGLQNLVNQKTPTDQQKTILLENVEKILNVNPLGIHIAIQLLKKANIDQGILYDLMKRFFEQKVAYLEKEFADLKVGQPLNFDVRYNIEEAFFYPETIKTEIDTAKNTGNTESIRFTNEMNAIYERLVSLLRKYKEKLRAVDVPVEIYERKLGKEPVYCILHVREGHTEYTPIFTNLDQLESGIDAYYKPYTTQRLRNYVVSETIKMLSEIARIYSESCPTCLGSELENYDATPELKNKVNSQLEKVLRFLTDLKSNKDTMQNYTTLNNLFTNPTCRRPMATW